MELRIDPGLLWAGASVVGLLAFGLGVLGHVSADGLLPGSGVLVGPAVISVRARVPGLPCCSSPEGIRPTRAGCRPARTCAPQAFDEAGAP